MNFAESTKMALTSLRTNKMRSALTLLGVIIGIAAVIAIVTLGHSLQSSVQKDLDKVGANNFTVQVKERPEEGEEEEADDPFMGGGFVEDESSMLTPDMLDRAKEVMGDQIAGINIGEYSSYSGTLVVEGDEQEETANLLLRPTNPDYVSGSSYSIVTGRFLNEDDIDSSRAVTMLDKETAAKLFGAPEDAIGQYVSFETHEASPIELAVIGVFEEPQTGLWWAAAPANTLLSPTHLRPSFPIPPVPAPRSARSPFAATRTWTRPRLPATCSASSIATTRTTRTTW